VLTAYTIYPRDIGQISEVQHELAHVD
jgi:hypothetical protein